MTETLVLGAFAIGVVVGVGLCAALSGRRVRVVKGDMGLEIS